jgi:hypothetical protein
LDEVILFGSPAENFPASQSTHPTRLHTRNVGQCCPGRHAAVDRASASNSAPPAQARSSRRCLAGVLAGIRSCVHPYTVCTRSASTTNQWQPGHCSLHPFTHATWSPSISRARRVASPTMQHAGGACRAGTCRLPQSQFAEYSIISVSLTLKPSGFYRCMSENFS